MQIQEYLICAIQNIQVLIGCGSLPKKGQAMALQQVKMAISKNTRTNFERLKLAIRFFVKSTVLRQRAVVPLFN